MPRKLGALGRRTVAVRDRIEHAFNVVNGPQNAGLIQLAAEHPAIFYGMVAKLIPQQATLAVTHAMIDLGAAMQEAQARLERAGVIIDVTPGAAAMLPYEPGDGEPAPAPAPEPESKKWR